MSEWLDPTGRSTYGIGICDRCKEKFSIEELLPDPNSPGLRVCVDCCDIFDPYRLPARQAENIALRFARPDNPLTFDPNSGIASGNRAPPVTLSGSSIGSVAVSLHWTSALDPVQEYKVYRSINGGGFSLLASVSPVTLTYLDSGLDLGANTYTYYVAYVDFSGVDSDPSNMLSFHGVPEYFVATCTSSRDAIYSTDTINWTLSAPYTGTQIPAVNGFGITFGTGFNRWYITTNPFNGVGATSDDAGATWNQQTPNPGGLNMECAAYAFGTYFSGSNNAEILKSTTALGGSWTTIVAVIGHASYDMHFASSLGVLASAGSSVGVQNIRYTLDGAAWSVGNLTGLAAAVFLYAIWYDADRALWFALNNNNPGKIYTTPSLVTGPWTLVGSLPGFAGTNNSKFAFKPGGAGQPIVLATASRTFVSTDDGATWTLKLNSGTGVVWSDFFAVFISVGGSSLQTSPDGVTWTSRTIPVGKTLGGIGKAFV